MDGSQEKPSDDAGGRLVCPGCKCKLVGPRVVGIYRCEKCDTLFYLPKKGVTLFEYRYKGAVVNTHFSPL